MVRADPLALAGSSCGRLVATFPSSFVHDTSQAAMATESERDAPEGRGGTPESVIEVGVGHEIGE